MSPKILNLSPILSYIQDYHDGSLLSLANSLDQVIYLFHYLPADTVTEFERQNVSHMLMGLKEAVMEVYFQDKTGISDSEPG